MPSTGWMWPSTSPGVMRGGAEVDHLGRPGRASRRRRRAVADADDQSVRGSPRPAAAGRFGSSVWIGVGLTRSGRRQLIGRSPPAARRSARRRARGRPRGACRRCRRTPPVPAAPQPRPRRACRRSRSAGTMPTSSTLVAGRGVGQQVDVGDQQRPAATAEQHRRERRRQTIGDPGPNSVPAADEVGDDGGRGDAPAAR